MPRKLLTFIFDFFITFAFKLNYFIFEIIKFKTLIIKLKIKYESQEEIGINLNTGTKKISR